MPSVTRSVALSDQPSGSPFVELLNRLQPAPETLTLMLAVVIGGGAGLGVLAFRHLIDFVHHLLLEDLMGKIHPWGAWTLACVPTIGGLLVGLMRWQFKDLGPGISGLITAVQSGKELSSTQPPVKTIAAAISLGSGASLGPEGPSVEIGANFGALLGQWLKMSQERQRLLLGAGAAAGLAAGFNAPIAGVFFGLEVVLKTAFETSSASVVLLSAVLSALVAQIGLGAQPAFNLPDYQVRSPLELPLYLGLGLCACGVAIAYSQVLKWMQSFFQGQQAGFGWMAVVPREVQPVIGGLCMGLAALVLPQTLGIGYDTMEAVLRDVEFPLLLLITLLVAKLLLTAISLGSGLVGGIFAPAMFLGAALGAAYGEVLPFIFPMFAENIAGSPAYAMVGMAAVLAATVRAPLTAILLLFEMTRDYRIVLPLMAAVGLSVWLMDRLKSKPQQRTNNLEQIEEKPAPDPKQEVLMTLLVSDAIVPDFLQLADTLSVSQAGLELIKHHSHIALVINRAEQVIGVVSLQDVNRAIARWKKHHAPDSITATTLGDVCTTEVVYAYANEKLADAIERMYARGLHQLPVVDREDPSQVLGLLHQDGITLACDLALTWSNLLPYLEDAEEQLEEYPVAELASLN